MLKKKKLSNPRRASIVSNLATHAQSYKGNYTQTEFAFLIVLRII